ncbi:MAG: cytochrome d ubiquinol oxidase subunit II, partial [Actinomycetota bacterium]|nr:cytochrome d ubiquinol oxidase subunit II [Actinomycetota bacterium]
MSEADVVAAVLLAGATLYAVFGGADFGAGLWVLLPGRSEHRELVRTRIEHSVAPVWEANHVWLIFILVTMWTGFPEAFSAVMTTLYIPLAVAALGIVLRGSGFAFGKVISGRLRRQSSLVFEVSSILTPFFMGTVVGAIAAGEVPAQGDGDPITSWTGTLPIVTGVLFVVSGAFIASVFLVHDARAAGEGEVESHFRGRALIAGAVGGVTALAGLIALHADAKFVYDGLVGPGLPLVIASGLCGIGTLVLLLRGALRGLRPLAVGAVVCVIWGWGVAQHP